VGLYKGDGFLSRRLFGDFNHLMGNRVGKKDDQIRVSYKTLQIIRRLGVDFGLTPVFLTDVPVLTDHPVVPAYDYYAHNKLLIVILDLHLCYTKITNLSRRNEEFYRKVAEVEKEGKAHFIDPYSTSWLFFLIPGNC
jgi:hypothetical protein